MEPLLLAIIAIRVIVIFPLQAKLCFMHKSATVILL